MRAAKINPLTPGAQMTGSLNEKKTGDLRSPSLRPSERGLRAGVDQADEIAAEGSAVGAKVNALESLTCIVTKAGLAEERPTCKQRLWFSFFFDGTGNNLQADTSIFKHSNVAKLYRVHNQVDVKVGVYRIYIPGVGTYFPEIGDNGGGLLGLGTGSMGQERLDHALKEFDKYFAQHLSREKSSPSAQIVETNIAVFGFSRGAALARAFVNLMLEKRCARSDGKWKLKNSDSALRFRFMGIFDTVASVGVPMSNNTTSKIGAALSSVGFMIKDRLTSYLATRPRALAFSDNGMPGADPAPGKYDGHLDWGGRLAIDPAVEEVRHFIAAHENRNSFPVDSISILGENGITKPAHFYESVYPGVHSDVGGGYAPGEGGRSEIRAESLALVPLIHMYKHAIACGVPLRPPTAWARENKEDFEISSALLETYNVYLKTIKPTSSLGILMNQHMAQYFAWRFRNIRNKDRRGDESRRIAKQREIFNKGHAQIDKQIEDLKKKEALAASELNILVSRRAAYTARTYGNQAQARSSGVSDQQISDAQMKKQLAQDELLRAQARKLAHPNMESFQQMVDFYDDRLLKDVRAICGKFSLEGSLSFYKDTGKSSLRPHYQALVEAYRNEFERSKGMTDQTVMSFFDNYVHDSLAAFAQDATLPSDPRVVYLGGDAKYEYALNSMEEHFDKAVRTV